MSHVRQMSSSRNRSSTEHERNLRIALKTKYLLELYSSGLTGASHISKTNKTVLHQAAVPATARPLYKKYIKDSDIRACMAVYHTAIHSQTGVRLKCIVNFHCYCAMAMQVHSAVPSHRKNSIEPSKTQNFSTMQIVFRGPPKPLSLCCPFNEIRLRSLFGK